MALEEIANAEEIVNDLECSIYFCLERMLLDRQEKLSSVEVDMLHSISHSIVAQKHHQPSNLLEIKAHPVFQNTQRIFPEQNPLALVGIQVVHVQEYIFGSIHTSEILGAARIVRELENFLLDMLQAELQINASVAQKLLWGCESGQAILLLPYSKNNLAQAMAKKFAQEIGYNGFSFVVLDIQPIELLYGYRCYQYIQPVQAHARLAQGLLRYTPSLCFGGLTAFLQRQLANQQDTAIPWLYEPNATHHYCDSCQIWPAIAPVTITPNRCRQLCRVCLAKHQHGVMPSLMRESKQNGLHRSFYELADQHGYIALLSAEIQNIYPLMQSLKNICEYHTSTKLISKALISAYSRSIEQVCLQNRIIPLMLGKDGIVIVLSGEDALTFAYLLAYYFEEFYACNLSKSNSTQKVPQLGLCLGLAIAQPIYPIHLLLTYAQKCQWYARSFLYQNAQGKSGIYFMEVTDPTFIAQTQDSTTSGNPYDLPSFAQFLQEVAWVQEIPPSILHEILSVFAKGEDFVKHYFLYQVARNAKLKKFVDTMIQERQLDQTDYYNCLEKVLWREQIFKNGSSKRYSPFLDYAQVLNVLGKHARKKIAVIEKELLHV